MDGSGRVGCEVVVEALRRRVSWAGEAVNDMVGVHFASVSMRTGGYILVPFPQCTSVIL